MIPLGQEDPLEKGNGNPHSSIFLPWDVPWMEELGGLQSTQVTELEDHWNDFTLSFSYKHFIDSIDSEKQENHIEENVISFG